MFDINVKPLRRIVDLEWMQTAYRVPADGTQQTLQAKLRQAKKHLTDLQKESASAEVACQAVEERKEALTAERNAAKPTLDNAAEAMAKGTATLDDLAKVQARLTIIDIAWPAMVEETREKQRAAMDARHRARYAGDLVREIEADLIMLEVTEALGPMSGLLKKYFEKSGDAGLMLRPAANPAESPADTDD